MTILLFNWRDIMNPSGGGAEILTHEVTKRWVKSGHRVIQFSSSFPNARKEEVIDGVTFIRKGKWWTVHILGFFYYLKNKDTFDVIIDEVHWFPFFSALYARDKTIALTCEVASTLLFRIFPSPIAFAFLLIEKLYLFLYRNVPTMVISPSTRDDLIKAGHTKDNIVVLPMGLTAPKELKAFPKEVHPTLISVGRLNKQKGTLDVIDAFNTIHKYFPKSKLWLVGSGENFFMEEVNHKIKTFGHEDAIILWGFVTETEKFALLAKAHILISASAQEGWGLTIPEAGLMRTPSVVYNIAGFRDIIVQRKTGVLINKSYNDLAKETITLLQDKKRYKAMQDAAFKQAKEYSWDNTAQISLAFINKYIISV